MADNHVGGGLMKQEASTVYLFEVPLFSTVYFQRASEV
jgi:hypothetical protein